MFSAAAKKTRRPAGVSRRRRPQFGFETLEDRRVMAAQSPLATLAGSIDHTVSLNVQSYSSATQSGASEALLRELYWQSLMSAVNGPSAANTTFSLPTDPLYGRQWHLSNSGQQVGNPDYQSIFGTPGEDINVAPVWNMGLTGAGVTVAVIDTGLQLNHPDLIDNVNLALSFDALDPLGNGSPLIGGPELPNILDDINAHGTAVAGLIGAVRDNGIGGSGVAPGVTLAGIRLIDIGQFEQAYIDAFRRNTQIIDITNNSWGPGDNGIRALGGPTPQELLALRDSVIFGRGGLGVIHVFASGNDAGPSFAAGFESIGDFDSANYNGWTNSRYTIAVTGVDHDGGYNNVDGTVMAYPEAGSNILVAAPTGSNAALNITEDTGLGSGLWTTDLIGEWGINRNPNPITGQEYDRDFLDDTIVPNANNYTSRMNGTSASAPIVSGVIALMLEANENLTWRDVQEILVRSARQNAQFETPTNGAGDSTQSTWIVNQVPVFHDPDLFVQGLPFDPLLQTRRPLNDPNATTLGLSGFGPNTILDHYVAAPFKYTNGAGYTVSQGTGVYGEQIGYGHGVVDAELAVLMAQQWHTKNQALPSELTFSTFVNSGGPPNTFLNIPASERASQDAGFQIVPGGIGGQAGFISYWNEYFTPDAFQDPNETFPFRGGSLSFSVPANNSMSIETVEVKLHIGGSTADLLDHVRILLVSPDGTQSELNHWVPEPHPNPYSHQFSGLTDAVPLDTDLLVTADGDETVWTFSTNRSWGERAGDALVFDPVTNEPVTITSPLLVNAEKGLGLGDALTQGWRIVIENYDAQTSFQLLGTEVAWHGSPIAANSQRVQGFVGIDQNRDGDFNYSRGNITIGDNDNDPTTTRLGDVVSEMDLTQEQFAGNVTVTVRRTADNSLVDQFVTGHDGNFYFDLIPDDYTISIEDPLGRTTLQDTTTGAQFVRHYQTEWQITEDWFNAWDHDANFIDEVRANPDGSPVAWLDGNGQTVEYGMRGINFLLDPGDDPVDEVRFEGFVYADTNGDGQFNSNDVGLPNVTVFADVNRDGVRNAGEVTAVTDATGMYVLVAPTTFATVMNVGVSNPFGWQNSNPANGLESLFVKPGSVFVGVDFHLTPPPNNAGGGGAAQPGIIMGVVFEDANNNGTRQAGELGAPGFRVYIDNNNNGVFDAGDRETTTNQFGGWAFANVAPGQRTIRIEAISPFGQTSPSNNAAHVVTLTGSSTVSGIAFGVRNTAVLDFGDLPAIYGATLLNENGARHPKGNYYLGARVDAELNGNPGVGANGDDVTGLPDDDGIEFLTPLTPGTQGRIRATASTNLGYLQAWADWNNDGDFNDVGERIITNRLLKTDALQNEITFAVPGDAAGQVYMRFRYGEFATPDRAINTPFGAALTGEVEDYLRTVPAVPSVVIGTPADFDQDDDVDGFDFLNWQRNVGKNSGVNQSHGNANSDGVVNGADLKVWKQSFGSAAAAPAATFQTGDFDGNGFVDGGDFLAMQRGFGVASGAEVTQGDGTADGKVNSADVAAWAGSFGEATATASAGGSTTIIAGSVSTSLAPQQAAADEPLAASVSVVVDGRTSLRLAAGIDRSETIREALRERLDVVRQFVEETAADVRANLLTAAERLGLDRDRAFEDLLGNRRRQGLVADAVADFVDQIEDSDEAFAALADHFQWR